MIVGRDQRTVTPAWKIAETMPGCVMTELGCDDVDPGDITTEEMFEATQWELDMGEARRFIA